MLDREIANRIINTGRDFMKGYGEHTLYENEYQSDQELKLPQPPLVKAAMRPEENRITLTRDFSKLEMKNSLIDVIRDRKSSRVYTQETMTVDELAFLLWATQGVKEIRGRAYATIRTVPCGGARHEFETYLLVRNVEGLENGAYHYLPMEHALEFLHPVEDMDQKITASLCEQGWAAKANVIFYWSMVAYRVEWRYGIFAHRPALMDIGHVGQNLYLGCSDLGLGCCAIAAFQHEICNELFDLDGKEEFVVYAVPVGTISEKDKTSEKAFYQFVEDEGL